MEPGFHQRLVLCTGGVLLLHVAALASLQGARLVVAAPPGAMLSGTVQSRWIEAEAPALPAGGVRSGEAAKSLGTVEPLEPNRLGPGAPVSASSEALGKAPVHGPEQRPPQAQAGAAATPVPKRAARTVAEADYLPRPLLSLVPAATAPIPIDYPPIEGDAGHYRAVLDLFIDETGHVRRVRAEGRALPAPLEEAARSAFMSARFTPGEVDGVAVRSLIRVEVSFDHHAAP